MKNSNPPFCPHCGASAEKFVGVTRSGEGVCSSCFELVRAVLIRDEGVAPFLEKISPLQASAVLTKARTQLQFQLRR